MSKGMEIHQFIIGPLKLQRNLNLTQTATRADVGYPKRNSESLTNVRNLPWRVLQSD